MQEAVFIKNVKIKHILTGQFDKFLYIFAESEVKMSEDEDTAAADPREQLLKAHR